MHKSAQITVSGVQLPALMGRDMKINNMETNHSTLIALGICIHWWVLNAHIFCKITRMNRESRRSSWF